MSTGLTLRLLGHVLRVVAFLLAVAALELAPQVAAAIRVLIGQP